MRVYDIMTREMTIWLYVKLTGCYPLWLFNYLTEEELRVYQPWQFDEIDRNTM